MLTGVGDWPGLRIPAEDATSGRMGFAARCTPGVTSRGEGTWFTTPSCCAVIGTRSLGPGIAGRAGPGEIAGLTAEPWGPITMCGLLGGTGGGTPRPAGTGLRGAFTLAGETT